MSRPEFFKGKGLFNDMMFHSSLEHLRKLEFGTNLGKSSNTFFLGLAPYCTTYIKLHIYNIARLLWLATLSLKGVAALSEELYLEFDLLFLNLGIFFADILWRTYGYTYTCCKQNKCRL